jgi:hypothetical protein
MHSTTVKGDSRQMWTKQKWSSWESNPEPSPLSNATGAMLRRCHTTRPQPQLMQEKCLFVFTYLRLHQSPALSIRSLFCPMLNIASHLCLTYEVLELVNPPVGDADIEAVLVDDKEALEAEIFR